MGAGPFGKPREPTEGDPHEPLNAPITVLRLFSSDVMAGRVTAMTWTREALLWLHIGASGVRRRHRHFFFKVPPLISVSSLG